MGFARLTRASHPLHHGLHTQSQEPKNSEILTEFFFYLIIVCSIKKYGAYFIGLTKVQFSDITNVVLKNTIKKTTTLKTDQDIKQVVTGVMSSSHNYYVNTVIWVANRYSPVSDKSGSQTISTDRNLILVDSANKILWSSNIATSLPSNEMILGLCVLIRSPFICYAY